MLGAAVKTGDEGCGDGFGGGRVGRLNKFFTQSTQCGGRHRLGAEIRVGGQALAWF